MQKSESNLKKAEENLAIRRNKLTDNINKGKLSPIDIDKENGRINKEVQKIEKLKSSLDKDKRALNKLN